MEQQLNNQSAPSDEVSLIYEENGTYCKVGSIMSGLLEVDLQCVKQKGTEERHVSFSVIGLDENNQAVRSEMFFLEEDSFNKFKAFIAKLNWND